MTAAEFRDFDTEEFEPLPPAGEFGLGGRRWSIKNRNDVEVGKLIDMAATAGGVLQFKPGEFFAETLVPDQVEDFAKLLDSPPPGVTRRKISAVMAHIFELVADFPTTPDSGSSSGSSSAKVRKPKSSKARSSSPATRRRASGE